MAEDITGIEFVDIGGRVIRKTHSIIENKVYAPIIRVIPPSVYEDRDFDGECMFSIEFVETLIKLRRDLNRSIFTGERI